jgi:hypothetical protein
LSSLIEDVMLRNSPGPWTRNFGILEFLPLT